MQRMMFEKRVVPCLLYGAETWVLNEREEKRLRMMEIKCIRSIFGVTRKDGISNEEIRR